MKEMKHTDEERAAWRATMNKLVKQVAAMSREEREQVAARLGIVTCEGHALSFYNQCFLAAQGAGSATIVAGFQQWRRNGRCVRKGEHACGVIYVPTGKRRSEDSEDEEAPSSPADRESVRFMLVPVFDVSQTEALETAASVAA